MSQPNIPYSREKDMKVFQKRAIKRTGKSSPKNSQKNPNYSQKKQNKAYGIRDDIVLQIDNERQEEREKNQYPNQGERQKNNFSPNWIKIKKEFLQKKRDEEKNQSACQFHQGVLKRQFFLTMAALASLDKKAHKRD